MLVLSHDEVVHGKRSLVDKMPGPDWQKFANLRLLYSYMICQPGKKLSFMGAEVGQWNEWDCKANIDWYLLKYPFHQGIFKMVRDLNRFYVSQPSLWAVDFEWQGYQWIDFSDAQNSVISYVRKGGGRTLICIHNFTPQYHEPYWIHLPQLKRVKEVFNSDSERYGGSNQTNPDLHPQAEGFFIRLAPLATQIFEAELL